MKVFIIDSNYPEDHYSERADGIVAQHILKALGITADLRLALDGERFAKAVRRALREGCDVLHVSTHGNDELLLPPKCDGASRVWLMYSRGER